MSKKFLDVNLFLDVGLLLFHAFVNKFNTMLKIFLLLSKPINSFEKRLFIWKKQ